jgi:hypothetical protein
VIESGNKKTDGATAHMLHRPIVGILVGGGVAATLDLIYAVTRNGLGGASPLWTLQLVGSGWLGEDAFAGGVPAGVLGFVSHYAIVFVAAALYYLASKHLTVLRSRALVCGAAFGVLVYLFMSFVVLPMSAFPLKLSYTPARVLEGFVSHAFLVGVPIALAIRRFSGATVSTAT